MSNELPAHRQGHIDLLRGLAILFVIVLHAGVLTPGMEAHRYAYAAIVRLNCGMQLFFVLSGFLICGSWEHLKGRPGGAAMYALKRAAKIVPLYLIFLHVNLGIFFYVRATGMSDPPVFATMSEASVNLRNYVVHLLFLQGAVPAWLHTLVDGSWSVVNEVYFYALFPAVLARFCTTARGAFGAYLAALGIAIVTGPVITPLTPSNFGYYNFLYQLPCFVIGVVAYRVLHHPATHQVVQPWASLLLAFCAIAGVGIAAGNVVPMGAHNLYGLLFAIALVALSSWTRRDIWSARLGWLRHMGVQSYALFYVHLVLLWTQFHWLQSHPGMFGIGTMFLLNLVTGLLGSMILAQFLVNPIDRFFVRVAADRVKGMQARFSLPARFAG